MIIRSRTLLFLPLWCLLGSVGWGQAVPRKFTENQNCITCHQLELEKLNSSEFLGYKKVANEQEKAADKAAALVWKTHDKHRDAFRLLYQAPDANDEEGAAKKRELVKNILGFEMSDAFADKQGYSKFAVDDESQSKVKAVQQCLNCHATWPQPAVANEPFRVPLADGVSCQVCHGAGFFWNQPHQHQWWRLVAADEKHKLGFTNVRDPVTRAELCTSCHVGDFESGRYVTHDWYAGGHPPLPGFEFSTFASSMPVHWRSLRDKQAFEGRDDNKVPNPGVSQREDYRLQNIDIRESEVKSSYREANFPNVKHDPFLDLARLRDTIITGSVVLERYARLVERYSEEAAKPESQLNWPEFALYDCASCHHQLRSGIGYPKRPFAKQLPLGRPPAQVWPEPIAHLGAIQLAQHGPVEGAADIQKLRDAEETLSRALTGSLKARGRVFGDPSEIKDAAKALRILAEGNANLLKGIPYDAATAKLAIQFLAEQPDAVLRDFHSARQIAWAIQAIKLDLHDQPLRLSETQTPIQNQIAQLFQGANQSAAGKLFLTLPARQDGNIMRNNLMMLPGVSSYKPDDIQPMLDALKADVNWLPARP